MFEKENRDTLRMSGQCVLHCPKQTEQTAGKAACCRQIHLPFRQNIHFRQNRIPGGGDAYALMRRFLAPVYESGKFFTEWPHYAAERKVYMRNVFFRKIRAAMVAFLLTGAVVVNGGFCGCVLTYAAANGETGIQAAGNSPATEGDSRSKAAAIRSSRDNRPEAASQEEDNAKERTTEEISETVSNTQKKNAHEESNAQEKNAGRENVTESNVQEINTDEKSEGAGNGQEINTGKESAEENISGESAAEEHPGDEDKSEEIPENANMSEEEPEDEDTSEEDPGNENMSEKTPEDENAPEQFMEGENGSEEDPEKENEADETSEEDTEGVWNKDDQEGQESEGALFLDLRLLNEKPKAGETLVYEITVENTGRLPLSDLDLNYSFGDPGLKGTWETAENTGGDWEGNGSQAADSSSISLEKLEPGMRKLFYLRLPLLEDREDPVRLKVTAAGEDRLLETDIIPLEADFEVTKSADRTQAAAGDRILFSICIRNTGERTLHSVLTSERLQTEGLRAEFLEQEGAELSPSKTMALIPEILPGQAVSLRAEVALPENVEDQTLINEVSVVTAETGERTVVSGAEVRIYGISPSPEPSETAGYLPEQTAVTRAYAPESAPKTGDGSRPVFWFSVSTSGAAAGIYLLTEKRRRRKRR